MVIDQEVHAPTLLSMKKKVLSGDILPSGEEMTTADDDEEDPMVANLEQDEIEAETQRKPLNKVPIKI